MAAKKSEFLILNRRTGKALQASGTENGSAVVQAEIDNGEAQIWLAVETADGVKLLNKLSQKLLDVTTGGEDSGLPVQVWEDVNGASQVWKLAGRQYKKIINAASGKVLDIAGMCQETGAPAQIWEDIGGENQQWKLRDLAAETSKLKSVKKTVVKKPEKKTATKRKPVMGKAGKTL